MSENKPKSPTKKELLELLRKDPDRYLELSPAKKKDKDIALMAMLASSDGIAYMSSGVSYSLDYTVEHQKSISLDDIPLELREDKDFILSLFKDRTHIITGNENTGFVPLIPKRLMDNKEVVLAVLESHPKALKLASDRLRNDIDVVMKATDYYVENIYYASDELKQSVKLQASIIARGIDRDLWTMLMVPQKIITKGLMDGIYENDIGAVLKIVDGKKNKVWLNDTLDMSIFNQFYELAITVLRHPNKTDRFYIEKILLKDHACQQLKRINGTFDNRLEVVVMEHCADQLSLDCLKGIKAGSLTFQDLVKKREVKEISFNPNKSLPKNKKSRKLLT